MLEFPALLVVSTLFGGMTLYSFGLAPMVFSALPAPEAGRFLRAAFPWYYLFVIVTSGLGAAILWPSNSLSAGLALIVALVAIYARQILMPRINLARDAQLRGDLDAKGRFGALHGLSVGLNLVQLIVAACILYRFL